MILFPLKNYADLADVTVKGSDDFFGRSDGDTVPTSLPVENVQNVQLAKHYRVNNTGRCNTFVAFESTASPVRDIDWVALLGTNLSSAAKWRVTTSPTSSPSHVYEIVLPDGVIASSGYNSPVHTEVDDDPDAPSGKVGWHDPSSSSVTTDVRYSMDVPSSIVNLHGNAQSQIFRVRIGLDDGTGTPSTPGSFDYADVKCWLYDGGTLVGQLFTTQDGVSTNNPRVRTTVTDGGEVFSFFWDGDSAGLLADVQCRVECDAGSSSGMTGTVMSVAWHSQGDDYDYDSGWIDVFPSGFDPDDSKLSRNAFHGLTANPDWNSGGPGAVMMIQVWDEDNTDGFIEFGRVLFGEKFEPTYSQRFGWSVSTSDTSIIAQTRSGQVLSEEGARLRTVEVAIPGLTRAESQTLTDLGSRVGIGGEVCLIPDESDITSFVYEAVYGRFVDPVKVTNSTHEIWQASLKVEERVST